LNLSVTVEVVQKVTGNRSCPEAVANFPGPAANFPAWAARFPGEAEMEEDRRSEVEEAHWYRESEKRDLLLIQIHLGSWVFARCYREPG